MKQEEYFKLKSYINGIWNHEAFRQDFNERMHGHILAGIYNVRDVRFMKEIAVDPHLSTEISPEYTLAGKTKLIIKVVIEL